MHRLARLMLEKAPAVVEYVRAMQRTEREQRWLSLGLALAHYEEALAHGDRLRAEAHAKTAADLIDSLKADAPKGVEVQAQTKGRRCGCGRVH